MPGVKTIRADKTTEEPGVRHITLRGVEYTITEIDVPGYDEALAEATQPDGTVPWGKLLRSMVAKCVRPLPKGKPWSYPVYRTLEGIVNDMHFLDLPDEAAAESGDEESDGEGGEETEVPNA